MLNYRDINPCGSFVAWGISFDYEYDKFNNTLNIVDSRRGKPLLSFDYCSHLSQIPLNYISSIEKITQIQALILSNGNSIDLSDIYEGTRLVSFIESAIALSNYSWDLRREYFDSFNQHFSRDYDLKGVFFKRYRASVSSSGFYAGELKTQRSRSVSASADTLHKTIESLSERALRDLAAEEYTNRFSQSAQNLLTVSSNLSIISKALDDNYTPKAKMKNKFAASENMKNKILSKNQVKTIV